MYKYGLIGNKKMGNVNSRKLTFALQLRRKIDGEWKWNRVVHKFDVDITAGMEQVWEAAKSFTKEKEWADDFPGEILLYIVVDAWHTKIKVSPDKYGKYLLEKTGPISEILYTNDVDSWLEPPPNIIYVQPVVYSTSTNKKNENDSWFVWLKFEKGDGTVLRLEKVRIDESKTTGKDLYTVAAKIAANLRDFPVSTKIDLISNGKRLVNGKTQKIVKRLWHEFDEKIDFQKGKGIRVIRKLKL